MKMIILHKSRNKGSWNNSEELGSSGFRGEEAVLFANLCLPQTGSLRYLKSCFISPGSRKQQAAVTDKCNLHLQYCMSGWVLMFYQLWRAYAPSWSCPRGLQGGEGFPSARLRLDRTWPVGFHDGIEPPSGKLILQPDPGQYLLKLNFLFSTE